MYCHTCHKKFNSCKSLNCHITKVHKVSSNNNFSCPHCMNRYKSSKGLENHKRLNHSELRDSKKSYSCSLCDSQYVHKDDFLTHLEAEHQICNLIQELKFNNPEDLEHTLKHHLRDDIFTFYKATGVKKLLDNNTSYYNCSYGGNESKCASFIKVVKYKNNKSKIIFCKFHNHEIDFDKVKLPFDIKKKLILKIKQKIELKEIYKELLDDIGTEITKKSDMVNMAYLRYLKSRYADPLRYKIDDIHNLQNLIKKRSKNSNKTSKLFTFLQYDENTTSKNKKRPFIFAFSSTKFDPSQYNIFHTIMADSTFGTNQYNLSLTVFGFVTLSMSFLPFLYIITDSESEENCTLVLKEYLNFTKKEIHASFFMSDMSSIFYNSWCNTFQTKPKWLYCIWHVKKAVMKQILRKIKNKEVRFKIEMRYEELTKIRDAAEFQTKLMLFERFTDRLCPEFSDYFKKFYSKNFERWCLSSRLNAVVNTNMYVESFFGVFKRAYLCNKSKNRLDFLFDALISFETHKNVSILRSKTSNQKQYLTYRAKVASNKHNMGLKLDKTKFKFITKTKSYTYKKHEIKRGPCSDCSINCKYICHACKICINRYYCSCLSFTMKKECCKHIHVAHELSKETTEFNTTDKQELNKENERTDDFEIENGNGPYTNRKLLVNDSEILIDGNDEIEQTNTKSEYDGEQLTEDNHSENSKNAYQDNISANNYDTSSELKSATIKQVDEMKNNIEMIYDNSIIRRIAEEITLLSEYILYSTSELKGNHLEVDERMKKRQKTQRSWYKKK